MKTRLVQTKRSALLLMVALLFGAADATAHCDTMNGPVVADARKALEAGTVAPVLKWVTSADEAEVEAAFARTMRVRATSADVREMADLYFFETLVRLHRMSEGVAYTGLKPATDVAPSILAADHALAVGTVEVLAHQLTESLRAALEVRFAEAIAAKAHAEHNVEAGRAFVAAYVRFTHLAEAIDAALAHADGSHEARTGSPEHAAH